MPRASSPPFRPNTSPSPLSRSESSLRMKSPPTPTLPSTFSPRFTHTYRLGPLAPGSYILAAKVNEIFEARNSFTIPVDPPVDTDAPTAELTTRTITKASDSPSQFAVTYSDPSGIDITTLDSQDVLVFSPCLHHPLLSTDACPSDWKAQRARLVNIIPLDRGILKVRAIYEITSQDIQRDGNRLYLTIAARLDPRVDPVPTDEIPDGFLISKEGRPLIGGAPTRLVSHLYRLGELESGSYQLCVHSRGQTLGCHRFRVAGPPPRVELNIAPITEAKDEHRFDITFADPTGLEHDAIRAAKV